MSTSKSKPSISSTNSQKPTKQQLINTINSILSLDVYDDEFNKFMNECRTRVNSSNENELNSMLKSLIFEHKIQSKYPLLIWLIIDQPRTNEPVVLKLIQNHSQIFL